MTGFVLKKQQQTNDSFPIEGDGVSRISPKHSSVLDTVFALGKRSTEDFLRMTDIEWGRETWPEIAPEYAPAEYTAPVEVPWMNHIVAQ